MGAPENRPSPKGKLIFQPLIFRDYVVFFVFLREGIYHHLSIYLGLTWRHVNFSAVACLPLAVALQGWDSWKGFVLAMPKPSWNQKPMTFKSTVLVQMANYLDPKQIK